MIRSGLISIARKLGRWILRRIIARGLDLTIGYLDGKIDDFGRRRARAKTARRKRWLAGRIRRWRAALSWLRDRRRWIRRRIVEEIDRELGSQLAMVVPGERYTRRTRAARRAA
jgi:hypothetical protein